MCPMCKREIETLAALGGHYLCPACADRLAHAAPDLLAACEVALKTLWYDNDGLGFGTSEQSEVAEQLRTTIARAKGESV